MWNWWEKNVTIECMVWEPLKEEIDWRERIESAKKWM